MFPIYCGDCSYFWQLALWKLEIIAKPIPSNEHFLSMFTFDWSSVFQTCSPPGLVLSLSPGLGSLSDGVPSPGAAFYRPASRTSPLYRPASRTSPPSRLGTSSPCNDLLMAMTNSPGEQSDGVEVVFNWSLDERLYFENIFLLLCGPDANISLFPFNV